VLEYKIGGPLTYVTASTHCKRFAEITVDHVLLNLSRVNEIDIDGIAALEVVTRSVVLG
jgi:MFS superfamily sulfate permease-like transporter